MKFKAILLSLICSYNSLIGSIDNSIIPLMNQLTIKDLHNKINLEQVDLIDEFSSSIDQRIRIISFNMLCNHSESELAPVDRWENRKGRVIEYIQWAQPDVIGSQELQADQLDDLLGAIGNEYDYYGVNTKDELREGEINAIFYRKDRFECLNRKTLYFSDAPEIMNDSLFRNNNRFTLCHLKDKKGNYEFIVLNTHLAFTNIQRRYYEANSLRHFLLTHQDSLPLVLTGDFNTFPFRQELDLPFYDGEQIISIIEDGEVMDGMKSSLFGHFGPIATTNYCAKKKKPFLTNGEPGVILDHIFVNQEFVVLSHGIDPAKVDGHFPSDHFPVIVDLTIKDTNDWIFP